MGLLKNYALYFNLTLPGCGGLLLQSVLSQNPDFFAPGKTPFVKALDALRASYWADFRSPESVTGITESAFLEGARGYADTFFLPAGRKIVIDCAPASFLALRELIEKITGGTKFILVVRDLRHLACSWVRTAKTGRPADPEVLGEMVKERFSQPLFTSGISALQSLAAKELPAQLFFIRYEDLCFSPRATLKLLYDFLGCRFYEHDLKNIRAHAPQALFFGAAAANLRPGALQSNAYEPETELGKKLSEDIVFSFRPYFKLFYPEVITANPAYLLTSEEAEKLAGERAKTGAAEA